MVLQIRLMTLCTFLVLTLLGVFFRSALLPQAKRVVAQWLELPSGSSPLDGEGKKQEAEQDHKAVEGTATSVPLKWHRCSPMVGGDHKAVEGTATSVSSERDAAMPDPSLPAEGRYAAEDPVPAPLIAPRPLRDITRGEIDTILRKRREAEAALDAVHRESGWQ